MTRLSRVRSRRRRLAALATLAVSTVGAATLLGPGTSLASSHREAPLIAADPQADNTDVYAFVSPDDAKSVTLIANWVPFEEPAGGPNFYPFAEDAQYDVHIDNDGDAKPDVTYRWTFTNHRKNPNTFLYNTGVVNKITDPTLNFTQTYKLEAIYGDPQYGRSVTLANDVPVAPSNVGVASMPNYASLRSQAVKSLPGNITTFAGQAAEPFFLDLRVFDLVYGGNFGEVGRNSTARYDVNTIALKLPATQVALKGDASRNPVIGVWSTTQRRSVRVLPQTDGSGRPAETGGWSQVSRLGQPLVNEVVIPVGQKDRFNASTPSKDAQFLQYVTNPELPKVIQSIYKIPAPATPRNDLVSVFLTGVSKLNAHSLNQDADPKRIQPAEELRLNLSIPPSAKPNRLGVVGGDTAGFPNGRRLADDVVDIELQAAEGVLQPGHPAAVDGLGDGVDGPAIAFGSAFPYLALPIPGSS
ncbi:DUF4331 domain-containing protein [Frankia sp. Cppng1_Ct_nod]|uniref:DUF4331 domain-containing protein n=1 Tax=Frankia sp. Cppng1_Ct_nod TaxID=2897162 RepID=UPI0010418E5B|nr:DUF4331 domain-containing protein [Frankia sp. Cppng1_Ct_nod]